MFPNKFIISENVSFLNLQCHIDVTRHGYCVGRSNRSWCSAGSYERTEEIPSPQYQCKIKHFTSRGCGRYRRYLQVYIDGVIFGLPNKLPSSVLEPKLGVNNAWWLPSVFRLGNVRLWVHHHMPWSVLLRFRRNELARWYLWSRASRPSKDRQYLERRQGKSSGWRLPVWSEEQLQRCPSTSVSARKRKRHLHSRVMECLFRKRKDVVLRTRRISLQSDHRRHTEREVPTIVQRGRQESNLPRHR